MDTESTPATNAPTTGDTPRPAGTTQPVARPESQAMQNMGLPQGVDLNRPKPPPKPQPVLPTLPRTTNLLASDTHGQEVLKVAGPMGDREGAIVGSIAAQKRMAESLEALERARQTRNPKDTAAQHLERVERAYSQMLTNAAREHDVARMRIRERRKDLETQINDAIGMTASADAAEIRQALRSMKPEERGKAVQAAIDNRDGAVLHAVFTGRELTTGITAAQQRSFRRRAEERHAPELGALRAGLDKAEALVSGAFDDLSELESKVKGSPQVVDAFSRQVAESDAAWLAFGKALGSD